MSGVTKLELGYARVKNAKNNMSGSFIRANAGQKLLDLKLRGSTADGR